MALDKLVDSTQLDSDLTSVANAIRAKSGGSSQLAFPAGFVSEIQAIPSGGGTPTLTLLASGSYTKTNFASDKAKVDIPVSFSGTPIQVVVYAPEPLASTAQTYKWYWIVDAPAEIQTYFSSYAPKFAIYRSAANATMLAGSSMSFQSDNTVLRCNQQSSNYRVQNNTYDWYIWGYAT